MDEQRLERALRQGPPFVTRYVSGPLALDEPLGGRRGAGTGRLVLLVAVTALLLAGMLGGLAALGSLRDDSPAPPPVDASVIRGLDGQAFMAAWEATGSRSVCSGPQPATQTLLQWTCEDVGDGNLYDEGVILLGESASAIHSIEAWVALADGGGPVDADHAGGLFAFVAEFADFTGGDPDAARAWALENGGRHSGQLEISGVTYTLSGPAERWLLKIAPSVGTPSPSTPASDFTATCLMSRSGTDLTDSPTGALDAGTYAYCGVGRTLANVQFTVPAGWEWHGSFLSKGGLGSPNEARISVLGGDLQVYTDPCRWSGSEPDPPTGRTVADLIDALAAQPMRDAGTPTERYAYHVSSDRTLPPSAHGPGVNDWRNGWEGMAIELTVPADIDLAGCDEGQFRSWAPERNVRAHQGPGQRDLVWVITTCAEDCATYERVVIDASWLPATPADVVSEIDAILESIATGHWG